MPLIGVIALVMSVAAVGAALLSMAGRTALGQLSYLERTAFAVLVGMVAGGLICLFALLAGYRFSGWWWAGLGGAGLIVSACRWSTLACRAAAPRAIRLPAEGVVHFAMVAIFIWAAIVALALPPMDYDTFAIWGHRLHVLLEERALNTPSLRDPLRFVAQPLHPYLVPVVEASFCIAAGGFSIAARNAPHLLAYGCYLVMVAGAARRIGGSVRCPTLMAAAGLMPVLATAPILLSSREFLMAVLAFACVRAMTLWIESSATGALVLAALCALGCQQVKIEGLPLAVGSLAGAVFWGLFGGIDRRRGVMAVVCAAAVFLLAVPWALAREAIPPVNVEGLVKGFDISMAFNVRHLLDAVSVLTSEVFARPEFYGLAGLAALAGLVTGWRRDTWRMRVAILLPPMLLLAAILANLSARVGEGPERLFSLPRRMMIVLPSLLLASLYAFPSNRRDAD